MSQYQGITVAIEGEMTVPKLPVGTLTFLFTDIEGSTTRWESHAEEMRVALVRHDALLRQIAEAHAGVVFKTVGDAFYVVFSTAIGGVEAAVEAQKMLAREEWPEHIRPFRVRMAIHTGEATQRGHDYFGQTLNRVARLLSAGHGGQILLSATTAGLVRDRLPGGVELKDLGVHRLKDIQSAERIFQVVAAGVRADFPPLKTLSRHATHLPAQLTYFVGRKKEVDAVGRLLCQDSIRLVTLVGPGGVGKTRLALQAAADNAATFPSGVYFIDLSSARDRDGLLAALARALGVSEEAHRPLLESIKEHLNEKALLLLDSFEHLLDVAFLVHEMLVTFRHLKVLVTSRASLHISGEYEYHVEPLLVPDYRRLPELSILAESESVALFLQQAVAVKPDFRLTATNARAIAEICVRLDGLPLAIELAAACVNILTPQALLKRLGQRLQMLNSGKMQRSQRQQTLRETIAWSYQLLTPLEKDLFCQLSVFSAGCTLEAVEHVCVLDEENISGMLALLQSLIHKSLLRLRTQDDEEPRFEMLRTIREYAAEMLMEDLHQKLQQRHAHYYLVMMEQHSASGGVHQKRWLRRVEDDYENVQDALDWFYRQGQIEAGLRLAEALWYYWWVKGLWREGRAWFEKLLATPVASPVSPLVRAKALMRMSELVSSQGDYAVAEMLAEEALKISVQLDDKALMSNVYVAAAQVALQQGNDEQAVMLLEESLKLRRQLGDLRGMASLLNNLGNVARQQKHFERALTLHQRSLTYFRQMGDEMAVAAVMNNLADVEWCLEHYDRATKLYEESLDLSRSLGYSWGIASSLVGLADAARSTEQYELARTMYKESLHIFQEMNDQSGIAACIEGLSEVIRTEYALEAHAFGATQMEVVGYSFAGVEDIEEEKREISRGEILARMRLELGEELFDALPITKPVDLFEGLDDDVFKHDV